VTIISGYVAGDDLDIERDVTSVIVSDPITKAWLTIKTSPTVLDASATLQKVITSAAVQGTGQITEDGSEAQGNGTATVIFALTAADTLALGTTTKYYYDIQVKTQAGKILTVETGRIIFLPGVTDAAS
jgi:hypothetical protein